MNLNLAAPAAAPAARATAGKASAAADDAAASGDFLAVLAALVGEATAEATSDGTGALQPGSPLLAAVDELPQDVAAELGAELGAVLEGELAAEPAADEESGPAWPTVQALAALFAQPTPSPRPTATGDGAAVAIVAGDEVAADTAAAAGTAAAVGTAAATDADTAAELLEVVDAALEAAGDTEQPLADAADDAADGEATLPAAMPTGADGGDGAVTTQRAQAAAAAAATTGGAMTVDADGAEPTTDDASVEPAPAPARSETATPARPVRTDTVDAQADPLQAGAETRATSEAGRNRAPMASTAAGISRVLDALEQLEHMPPPRQVTLELGDMRVRLAMEDGNVRMQLLGEQRDAGRDFLRAANEALRERGFDLAAEDGRGDPRGDEPGHQRSDLAPPRPERGSGRPSRTDPTGTGVRPGIHL